MQVSFKNWSRKAFANARAFFNGDKAFWDPLLILICFAFKRSTHVAFREKSMLVELSSTDSAHIMGLTDDAWDCLIASTLQLKMLAMLLWEWAIANLCYKWIKTLFWVLLVTLQCCISKIKETITEINAFIWYELKKCD